MKFPRLPNETKLKQMFRKKRGKLKGDRDQNGEEVKRGQGGGKHDQSYIHA